MRRSLWWCVFACLIPLIPAATAAEYDLVISEKTVAVAGNPATGMAINDSIPGPTLRWREGEQVTLRVTNRLRESTSIHWHGIILPYRMDGVPGLSFDGIPAGQTFTYRFQVRQAGTYWYHSHSGTQEQSGVYGSIVVEPADGPAHPVERDYVVVLSDWTNEDPNRVLANLKRAPDYYNFQRRTAMSLVRDIRNRVTGRTVRDVIADRLEWARMRMDPTDIADVTGATYTYLLNGQNPDQNWTALFSPGERIRLRFINAAAMTYFDVKIPGLEMLVVQADGQNVEPVAVSEMRIAVAETFDVIVRPARDRAYTIFARSADRSGYARGTLAVRPGETARIPELGERPLVSMEAMMAAMGHGGHLASAGAESKAGAGVSGAHDGHARPMRNSPADRTRYGSTGEDPHAAHRGHGNSGQMNERPAGQGHAAHRQSSSESAPGRLDYGLLRAVRANQDLRPPERVIEMRLTGSMERYIWTINGQKFSDAPPIRLRFGERVRLRFVNTTMMAHPMHLHGMWMELRNGAEPALAPRKHTINVEPGQTIEADVTADAVGEWAFHCHLLYHMETGMFRRVIVTRAAS